MTPDERQLLTGLFDRIRDASRAPREPEAEAMIADAVRQQPYAPYLLAQTVLIQEEALKAANGHIEELEEKLRAVEAEQKQPTSFLGGLGKAFGSSAPTGRTPSGVPSFGTAPQTQPSSSQPSSGVWNTSRNPQQAPAAQPWGGQQGYPQQGYPQQQQPGRFGSGMGGSFLGSALATAAGVAGGAMLFHGLQSAFSGNHGSALLDQTAGKTPEFTGSDPTAGLSGFGSSDAPQFSQLPPERPTDDAGFFGTDAPIEDANFPDPDLPTDDSGSDWT